MELTQTVSIVTGSEDLLELKQADRQITGSLDLFKFKQTVSYVIGSEELLELKKSSVLLLGRGIFATANKLITPLCSFMSIFIATFYKLNYVILLISYIHCMKYAALYGCNATYNHVAPRKAIQLVLFNIVLIQCTAMEHVWTRNVLVSCSVINYTR